MIEPVSDDFTMSTRPAWRAKDEMMISGAFPSVALSRPPTVGPRIAGEGLGGVAHQARQRDDRQRRRQEHQDRAGPEPVQADPDRDEHQQPVQAHRVAPAPAWSRPGRGTVSAGAKAGSRLKGRSVRPPIGPVAAVRDDSLPAIDPPAAGRADVAAAGPGGDRGAILHRQELRSPRSRRRRRGPRRWSGRSARFSGVDVEVQRDVRPTRAGRAARPRLPSHAPSTRNPPLKATARWLHGESRST